VIFFCAEGEDLVDPFEKGKVVARGIGFDIDAIDGYVELSHDIGEEGFSIEGVEEIEEDVECIVELTGRDGSVFRDEGFEDDCDI
jgi:hypothetical protein